MEIIDYSVLYTFSLVSWNQFLKLSKPCTVCVIPLSNKYMYTYIYTAKVYLAKVVDRKLHVLWGWVGLNLVATSALLISTLLLQWVTNEDTVHLSSNRFVKLTLLKGKCHVKTSVYVIANLSAPALLCVNKSGWIFQVSPEGGQVPYTFFVQMNWNQCHKTRQRTISRPTTPTETS